jgi:protein TonB
MAVQILNDMPDAAVHRGESLSLRDWKLPRAPRITRAGRPLFIAITLGLHTLAALAFVSVKYSARTPEAPAPIVASLIDAPEPLEEAPPMAPPPLVELTYALPVPEQLAFEAESITTSPVTVATAIEPSGHAATPPMVESVQYVKQPAPVYPQESRRRRERGTVVLRVLVDSDGRPAQIQVERSSGFERLDLAAREAVEKALFRPHEVNGVRQAAQVLIPIEFTRRAS